MQAAINAQVYVAVAVLIIAACVPMAQVITGVEGPIAKTGLVVGVIVEIAAVVACAVAVYLSSKTPPSPVPVGAEVFAGLGFAVVLVGSAGILLRHVLSLLWAALVSVATALAVLLVAVSIASGVGGLAGTQIEVAAQRRALDADKDSIWVAHADGAVTQIDPKSNSPVGREIELPIGKGEELFHIAAGLGWIWAVDSEGWLYKINPDTREVSSRVVRVGDEEGEITLARGKVWVNGYQSGTVIRIDPRTYDKDVFHVDAETAADIAFGGGWIWVANDYDRQVTQLDPNTGKVVHEIPLAGDANDIAYGDDLVWVTCYLDKKVVAIDPDSNTEVWAARSGRQPSGIAVVGNDVWVSNYAGDTLTEIDAETGEIDATLRSAAGPSDVARGFGSAWIANFDAGSITRISSD